MAGLAGLAGAARRPPLQRRRPPWETRRSLIQVPPSLQRLRLEIEGWLDLRCPERAMQRLEALLEHPAGRAVGLELRIRALVGMGRYRDALQDLEELRTLQHDPEWLELTEAWCRKRVADLPAAVGCMERLLQLKPRSAMGHYNLGCYLALLGQKDRAIDEVTVACGIDADFRELARDEPDLDALHGDERFVLLIRPAGETPEA